MAITDNGTARVLRGSAPEQFDGHAFASVSELPRVAAPRPRPTGNKALDAVRAAAWDEGFAAGHDRGFEAGHREGFERGLAEGRATGHREGMASAQQEALSQLQATVAGALSALESGTADLVGREAITFAEVEQAAVDLAIELAGAILDREVAAADDPGRDGLVRALSLAPDQGDLCAFLHPDDLTLLGDVGDLAPGRSLELVADPTVRRGGCLVEAGSARLDARIDTALQRAREVLSP